MSTANGLTFENFMDSFNFVPIASVPIASAPMESNAPNDFVPISPMEGATTFPNEVEGDEQKVQENQEEPHYPVLGARPAPIIQDKPNDGNHDSDDNEHQHPELAAPNSVKQKGKNKEIIIKSYDADLIVAPAYKVKCLSRKEFNGPKIVSNLHKCIDTGLKMNMTPKRIEQFNKIIFQTSIKQRQKIKKEYHKLYHEDLMNVISDKFKFNGVYKEILMLLMMDRDEVHTHLVEIVIHNLKDIKLLSALLCIHYNKTLRAIERVYDARHRTTLKDKIQQMTSDVWGKKTSISAFLWNIIHYKRSENEREVDMKLVKQDASNLLMAAMSGSKRRKKQSEHMKWFHIIFTQRSFSHLYFVISQFEESDLTELSLYAVVMNTYKATKDKMFYAIGSMILYLTKRDEFYADLLGNAIYRPRPNYCMFLRIIVERHDIDLKNIVDKYGRMALEKWIAYDFEKKDKDAAFLVKKLCGLSA